MNEQYLELAQQIRLDWGKGDALRNEGLERADTLTCHDDIPYGEHGVWNLTDIYHPKSITSPAPTIISIHGGGWVYSDKENYQYYCAGLAERGFTVVNFNYRLAPESPFPAALEDINTLFGWILENGERYAIDTDKLFAVGDSAGAQMLSQYLAMAANEEYAALYDFDIPKGLKIKAAALNCGIYDITERSFEVGNKLLPVYFCGDPARYDAMVDMKRYLNDRFPPSFVMTAHYDGFKNAAEPFCRLLEAADAYQELHIYGDESTPEAGHVFHCNVKLPLAHRCNDDECNFFRRFL